ncbi:MAG: amino acid permease, partial [Candidatus Binatia bacterium]
LTAIAAAAIVIPLFLYRHYVSDKGQFPAQMFAGLAENHSHATGLRKAGTLPYVTLVAGAAVILAGVLFSP